MSDIDLMPMTCNCLKQVSEKWPEPFHKPIFFNSKSHDMTAGDWAVKVYELNQSGTIKKGSVQRNILC